MDSTASKSAGEGMRLEDYFEFLLPDDIRFRGHRVGIEDVLDPYREGFTPDEIKTLLPTLDLEEIHAAIAYYLHNRGEIDRYLDRIAAGRERRHREWRDHPPAVVERLRALKAEREKRSA